MIIIYGESDSGKTTKALSLLNPDTMSVYFALDFDKRVKSSANIDVRKIKKCYEVDIRFILSERIKYIKGKICQVVIDPLNMFKNYSDVNLEKTIEELKTIEKDFNLEMILVVNILHHFPKNSLYDIEDVKIFKTKKEDIPATNSIIIPYNPNGEIKPNFNFDSERGKCEINRCISCRWYIDNVFPDMMPEICNRKGRYYMKKVNGLNKVRTV